MTYNRSRGFTLVEILTSAGILIVLAAIVLPVFARARIAGWKATTVSNLRQIAAAQLLYAGENHESFATGTGLYPAPWPTQIAPYIGRVPRAPFRQVSPEMIVDEPGYAVNGCLNMRSQMVDDPSAVVLLSETAEFRISDSAFFCTLAMQATDETMLELWRQTGFPTLHAIGNLKTRFYDGGNYYAHVDGSVAFSRKDQIDPGLPVDCVNAGRPLRWRFALQGVQQ